MGTPVWSHHGIVCTGERAFKALVKAAVAQNGSPAQKR
jgi:hypothetical protein